MDEAVLRLKELLFPSIADVAVLSVAVNDEAVRIVARSTVAGAGCPGCGSWSRRVHNSYLRFPADVPSGGRRVALCLRFRRFLCPPPRSQQHPSREPSLRTHRPACPVPPPGGSGDDRVGTATAPGGPPRPPRARSTRRRRPPQSPSDKLRGRAGRHVGLTGRRPSPAPRTRGENVAGDLRSDRDRQRLRQHAASVRQPDRHPVGPGRQADVSDDVGVDGVRVPYLLPSLH
ncbi:transposase family protein [Streptomyces sp. NBC_00269]|uniref:transposase family protein n=1 Tax=Streptomyces sp. NBC_00269 TaxID=2975696 RepID=UPI002E28E42F|nr:transposase family protein [Streptomyces sp. NBC_00269]